MREFFLACLLAVMGVLVTIGVMLIWVPAGFVVAGLLVGGWAFVVLGEIT